MLNHKKIESLADYFKPLGDRKERGVYFYRINGYNSAIDRFIREFLEAAHRSGMIIEGRIPNPDDKNLAYYAEIMGMSFQMDPGFINAGLKKWLPRMNEYQHNAVAASIYVCLDSLRQAGKNEHMLKNAYIKFMCWLYYRFEPVLSRLGNNEVPKILYEGEIGAYELMLISILSNAGCDVVLLQYHGDAEYLKLDPLSERSDALQLEGMTDFPQDYSLKQVENDIQEALNRQRLYAALPKLANCTNAWIKGKNVLEDIRTPAAFRGNDPRFFYNCFCRINGVEDKLTYLNDLYRFHAELAAGKRRVVIVDGEIPVPSIEEINAVRRKNAYQAPEQLLSDLSNHISCAAGNEIQALVRKAFLDVMLSEAKTPGMNMNRLTNKAVYLVCWIKRYAPHLFANRKLPEISCFIHFGACKNKNEALLLSVFGRLPVDTVIFVPDLNEKCVLTDPLLYEQHFAAGMKVSRFPKEAPDLQVGTSAYHAERELDALMYQDSGMYRDRQFAKANAVTLKTMYEEIPILWKEEVKYRPNFGTTDGIVNIPVIFSKVCGVKNGDIQAYWNSIRELMKEEHFLITDAPHIRPGAPNPMKAFATEFYKNGRLQRSRIREHKNYPYGFLREDVQEHILDKLQLLIDQRVIKGTLENGMEYMIIATVLNLEKELVRLLQKFDFTKKNPKLIWINTGEKMISAEDSIIAAFLNMAGFDIVFFVPAGYQSIEKHYNRRIFEEHQIGEYVYDLQIPDLSLPQTGPGAWLNFFKREWR